jgi:hypothetical protein
VSLNMSTAMTDSKTALKPLEPKVGGLAQTKTDKWIAWTGGKPKVDWSGFEDAKRVDHETPNQKNAQSDAPHLNLHLRCEGLQSPEDRTVHQV